jgi:hypothetical protein
VASVLGLLIALTAVAGVSGREFGTIYVDGEAYRTFANPARVDPGTGIDPIISFTNFDQGGVSQFGPSGTHGGRWAVTMATWTDPGEARLVTSYAEVLALEEAGDLTLQRAPEADFRCPILPNG